jgi:hypothetical protein
MGFRFGPMPQWFDVSQWSWDYAGTPVGARWWHLPVEWHARSCSWCGCEWSWLMKGG